MRAAVPRDGGKPMRGGHHLTRRRAATHVVCEQAVSNGSPSAPDAHGGKGGDWGGYGGHRDESQWYPGGADGYGPSSTVGTKTSGIVRDDGWVRHTLHSSDRYHEDNTKQLAAELGYSDQCVLVVASSMDTLAGAERWCEKNHPPGAPQHACWFKQRELFGAMQPPEKYRALIVGSRAAAEKRGGGYGDGGKGHGDGGKGRGGGKGDRGQGRGPGKGGGKGGKGGGGPGGGKGNFRRQVART